MCKLSLRGKTPSKGQGHEGREGQQIIFVLKIYQEVGLYKQFYYFQGAPGQKQSKLAFKREKSE